ncbi:hypothetical protein [Pseudomonas sp. S35]|uniref:hypothetical protein n=1 Tax=Pseudomonas sp. S35 TaxID=1573719 RepID=UPI0013592467|nr:hypothetical protein [Pseudomonas sp. S35]
MRTYNNETYDAVDMHRDGLLAWDFVEITPEMLIPISSDDFKENERALKNLGPIMGRKSQELIPVIIRLMRDLEPFGSWSSNGSDKTMFKCGSTHLHLGRPALPLKLFDKNPALRQLVLIPHLSARGPNGAWIIRRGPEHIGSKLFADKYAFYARDDGAPFTFESSTSPESWSSVGTMALFATEEAARSFAQGWDDEEETASTDVGRAEDAELFALFGLVDVVETEEHQLAVTFRGARSLDQPVSSLETLALALPSTPGHG